MSNENCSNATDSDLYDYLRDLSWLNNDNPEANRALLEGLHSGYTGYMEDQIIQQFSRRSQREMRNQTYGNQGTARNATSLTSHVSEDSDDPEYDKLHYLQLVLYGTSIRGPSLEGSGDPPPPSKKISRPTIGEERKAWLLEARKAYCFNKLQTQPPEVLPQGGDFSGNSKARVAIATCSESDSQYCRSETSSKGLAMKTVANKESCTYIFQQADGTMKPSNIRLSPRMEKLDKLIPTASKEFLNTLRIVSTISPQESENRIVVETPSYETEIRSEVRSPDGESEISNDSYQTKVQETDASCKNNVSGSGGRSYKEVFLYGPHSTTTTMIEEAPVCSRSCCRFPSLPKLKVSDRNLNGGESQSKATPLWSTVLQRRSTSSTCESCAESKLRSIPSSSGDNVKYCSENSPDFFMKKSRQPQSVVYADKVVTCQHMETILINQSPRKEILRRDDREYNTDQESKSDSESVSTVDDAIEVSRRASGIWIEAKTKGRGRKKKTVKLVE